MKLTKEEVKYLRSKDFFQAEGFIARLFAKKLKNKLSKDADFKKAVDAVDKSSDNLRKSIKNAQANGLKIPDELLVYAGMKNPR